MENPASESSQGPDESSQASQLSHSINAMAGLLLDEQTVEALLHLVVSLARSAMVSVDGASVSLIRGGRFETTTATSADVRHTDETQYRTGYGPCVRATQGRETINVNLAETRERWPDFADAALAAGYRSVLSTPIGSRNEGHEGQGALNLYSRTAGSFDATAEQTASALGDHATVVLASAAAFATAEVIDHRLYEALVTRDVIGQAKGVLIAERAVTADEAFDALRLIALRSDRTLRDVAAELVHARQLSSDPNR